MKVRKHKDVNGNIASVSQPWWPVGSIYLSVNNTNPSSYFGGTWEQIAKGRTLVGVDTSDTDFNTVKKIGGEKTHKLTINEMPNHNHPICLSGSEYHDYNATYDYVLRQDYRKYAGQDLAGYRGGDQSHNNLQPYVTAYRYVRIA